MAMNNTMLHDLLMELATQVTELHKVNQDLMQADSLVRGLQGLADEVGQHRPLIQPLLNKPASDV